MTGIGKREVEIPPYGLGGTLKTPVDARGLVLFAHGSGSSRFSVRNNAVAAELNKAGFATLLLDLLAPDEEGVRRNVFDISLLAHRLVSAIDWIRREPDLSRLPLGLFGASTGAAAALQTAAELGPAVEAVVSRGGRPDLARPMLGNVKAPTLLIVGGADDAVLELNRQALAGLACTKEISVIPGATHLFEEPGALDVVSRRAAEWFLRHLVREEVDDHNEDTENDIR